MMFFHNQLGLSVGGCSRRVRQRALERPGKLLDLLAHLPVPLLVIGLSVRRG